jgi:FAT domain
MVQRSYECRKSDWTDLFFACRTALRTQAGVHVAEFLLPFLVLDRLCYGNGHDQTVLLSEIHAALTFDENDNDCVPKMNMPDRRKAVSVLFSVLDQMEFWVCPETELRYEKKKQNREMPRAPNLIVFDWQQYEATLRIDDMLSKIPLTLRASAAAKVEMHACALRNLEMASRKTVAAVIFGRESNYMHRKPSRSRAAGRGKDSDICLMKDVLASLQDYETMSALVEDDLWAKPEDRAIDSIRRKESLQDWQGALHDYERAQQLNRNNVSLRQGAIRCLLELGHFESVLQQVTGGKIRPVSTTQSLAIEASWRLGRWESLAELTDSDDAAGFDPEEAYQLSFGKAMLSVQRKDFKAVTACVRSAKGAVMERLSNVARESYSRSYDLAVRLQSLREIEDTAEFLCTNEIISLAVLCRETFTGWDKRLDFVASSGVSNIINTRLALARLANDSAFEGELFLRRGKRDRKRGLLDIAANSFAKAEASISCIWPEKRAVLKSGLQMQLAKLKYDSGESSIALRMLGQEDIETMGRLSDKDLVEQCCRRVVDVLGVEKHGMKEQEIMNIFVRSSLQSTRWMIGGGLKGGAEVMTRFRIIERVAPRFEKGKTKNCEWLTSTSSSFQRFNHPTSL